MLFRFKILTTDKDSKILGMFGDCIKCRINIDSKDNADVILSKFESYLSQELAVGEDYIRINTFNQKSMIVETDLPENAYEIIMSWVH